MTVEIVLMPDVDGSGVVAEFFLKVGDPILIGDSIILIESDKATMEIPSSVTGVVIEWLVDVGDSIETGCPLVKVDTNVEADIENVEIVDPLLVEEVILMPDVGGKGNITEFYFQSGDSFSEGDVLALVESDKAAIDIPAPFSGTVVGLIAMLGESVKCGDALLRSTRLEKESCINEGLASESAIDLKAIPVKSFDIQTEINVSSLGINSVESFYAGPATRKLARELGVDLSQVVGSGNRSRILKDDVKQFVKNHLTQQSNHISSRRSLVGLPTFPEVDFSQFGRIEEKAMSGVAKATAAHMARCWLNIPHVTLSDEVDVSDLEAFRATINPDFYGLERKPTLLSFIIMVVAKALRKYPQFNTSLHADGERVIYKDYVHIGVAIDTPAGLVVPVIRDADKKSISELAKDLIGLTIKAREKKLKVEDMQGGCFTVSSLGANGGTGFTPIINGPEVAILGVARLSVKPEWDGQTFMPRKRLPLCLSFDHRVVNGADAGRFMAMLNQCLNLLGNTLL